jgi:hypothetical protein
MFETVTFRAVAPRQEAAMSPYAAIDLHSSNSVLAVMDGEGKPVLRCRRPPFLLIRRWYERKRARKHRVVAIKAVAHKLARACYHMLHEATTFDLTRAFG